MMSDGMEGMERIRRTSHTLERRSSADLTLFSASPPASTPAKTDPSKDKAEASHKKPFQLDNYGLAP